MKRPRTLPVRLMNVPGMGFSRQASFGLPTFVSHNNVVLNFMERGWIQSLLATGFGYKLEPGRLAVFWGAIPHRVEAFDPRGIGHSGTVPLGVFLGWPMPHDFTHQLIRGRVFFEPDPGEGAADLILMNRWRREIKTGDPEAAAIVLLELEARLRRLARACPAAGGTRRVTPRGPSAPAEKMLLLIASHFREDLGVADIASAVGIHPDYASRLFKQRFGIGLTDYISECRVAHAKALLATTDAKVLEVSMTSGFGSISQFHDVFRRLAGVTPRAFRQSLRDPQKSLISF